MPSPIKGFIYLSILFAICFLAALIVRFIKLYRDFLRSKPNVEEPDPKIYYVEREEKPKRKRRRPKRPNVAFKGIVLEPQKFKNLSEKEILSLPDAEDL
ncbi:MAG: hypothetical protein IJ800_04235 [Clostridia bacterium]|nr:hypothetical protein [Clostridia bacterium]